MDKSESSTIKFRDASLSHQAITMLKWLQVSEENINLSLVSEYYLEIQDVQDVELGDQFLDDEVDITIIKNFSKEEAFDWLQKSVQERKSKEIFSCGKCSNTVGDDGVSIQCDSCLLWYHYCCAGIDTSFDKSILNTIDWYCYHCITE